jgi:Peptidase family S41/Tricorn protease C1 domain
MTIVSVLSPSAVAQSLDGFWLADGYGLLVEIDGAKMSTSQITSISCVPWWTAKRSDAGGSKIDVVFNRGDADIRLTPGSSPDTLLMRQGPSISNVNLRRISARPGTCTKTLPNTPLENYAVFWQTYAEQFALFPLYRTDWGAVDRKYRPRVTASTTAEELFDILREMILPFHNAHTNINAASIHRQYIGYRPASEIGRRLQATSSLSIDEILGLFNRQAQRTKEIIESKYLDGKLRPYVNEMIHFGMLSGSIGYMRILAFDGYTKDAGFEQGAIALESALDDIFKDAERMKGLIIDVRVNTGGADPLCLAIASRLSGAKYPAYSKVARNNLTGALRFTARQPAWVEVSTRPGYRGGVVLLIGPDTLSGGETFAMALMGRTPKVTSIGENTQGVFSDVWGRKLPNGWTFGLPTELYLTSSGKSFDGRGVPPDIRVPVYPGVDLARGRDAALERAIKVLAER